MAAAATAFLVTTLFGATARSAPADLRWIGGWATSHQRQGIASPSPTNPIPAGGVADQTLRQIVRTSVGGDQLRIELSNVEGSAPVHFGRVTVGLRGFGAGLQVDTLREVRFGGEEELVLAPGQSAVSDPVNLRTWRKADIAVSTYVVSAPGPFYSGHNVGRYFSYLAPAATGDWAADETGISFAMTTASWYWLKSIDVLSRPEPVIVAIGDSITDGHNITPELDQDWPAILAERLEGRASVINAGIGGNTLSHTGCPGCTTPIVERFQRDVLDVPGVTHVVIWAGSNDLTQNVAARKIVDALLDVTKRARAQGLKVFVGTIAPRDDVQSQWDRERHGPVRHEYNTWLRRNAHRFDAVFDFDRVLQDPIATDQLRWDLDSGDRVHPNVSGLSTIAHSVDLRHFRA